MLGVIKLLVQAYLPTGGKALSVSHTGSRKAAGRQFQTIGAVIRSYIAFK